jgi:molecular chaperone HscB
VLDFARNHFELFGLPARYALDAQALDAAYRALQRTVHPDRHAASDAASRCRPPLA